MIFFSFHFIHEYFSESKMANIRDRVAAESQAFDKLRKLLMSAGSYTNLLVVVGRVFQRAPGLIKDMENQLEGMSFTRKISSWSWTRLVSWLVLALVLPISLVCLKGVALPRLHGPGGGQGEGQHQAVGRVPAQGLPTHCGGGQLDRGGGVGAQDQAQDSSQGNRAGGRIWFRITTTRKTKERVKNMKRVYKVKPTLVVYYSGEPYFYSLPIR